MRRNNRPANVAAGAITVIVMLAAACGGAATRAATTAVEGGGRTTTAVATTTGKGTSTGGSTAVVLVAHNLQFDKTKLTAPAGSVTFTLDNQDAGVMHNLHIFRGSDASGESMGITDLVPGPGKETLTLDLQKGNYYFRCDAHPTTMQGTLTVS